MKHYFKLLFCILFLSSCEKAAKNGFLDGQWQLMSIQKDEESALSDKKSEAIYWSFQLGIMVIHTPNYLHNNITNNTFGNYILTSDSLLIPSLYIHYYDKDSLITNTYTTVLNSVGIQGNSAQFAVESLTKNSLILHGQQQRLRFRKIGR